MWNSKKYLYQPLQSTADIGVMNPILTGENLEAKSLSKVASAESGMRSRVCHIPNPVFSLLMSLFWGLNEIKYVELIAKVWQMWLPFWFPLLSHSYIPQIPPFSWPKRIKAFKPPHLWFLLCAAGKGERLLARAAESAVTDLSVLLWTPPSPFSPHAPHYSQLVAALTKQTPASSLFS